MESLLLAEKSMHTGKIPRTSTFGINKKNGNRKRGAYPSQISIYIHSNPVMPCFDPILLAPSRPCSRGSPGSVALYKGGFSTNASLFILFYFTRILKDQGKFTTFHRYRIFLEEKKQKRLTVYNHTQFKLFIHRSPEWLQRS